MTPHAVRFKVLGVAQPKGSTKSFGFIRKDRTTGQPLRTANGNLAIGTATTSANPNLAGWETAVRSAAQQQCGGTFFGDTAVRIAIVFFLPRPQSLPRRVKHHTKKPDLDKLARAVKDALKGVLWQDDSQVVDLVARKAYASTQPHARILVDYAEVIEELVAEQDLFSVIDALPLAAEGART
jgi:Holliday junction resolvase RusA-like endonuclease